MSQTKKHVPSRAKGSDSGSAGTRSSRRQHNGSRIRTLHIEPTGIKKRRTPTKATRSPRSGSASTTPRKRTTTQRFRTKQRLGPKGTKQLIPVMRKTKVMPAGYDDSLRVIPIGGLGEVGRNMHLLEYKDEILIIDMGFGFPESDQPGIDYNLPNIDYLKDKIKNIQALVVTHGHMDHIGGIPYLINDIDNPPVYTSKLSSALIRKRHMEFPHLPELEITEVDDKDVVQIGKYFKVEFVHVNHNIPEDLALYITTPAGTVFHTGDWKFDAEPYKEKPTDLAHIQELGKRGVTLLMSDSTGATKDGQSITETSIMDNLEEIFKNAKGRIIAATFASLINRVQQMISLSEKYGRKVVIDGYSMKNNIEIMKEFGEIDIKKDTQIPVEQVDDYPDDKVTIIGTGAQGEERAVMMRVASGDHRYLTLKPTDTAIFSSSVIPGNERTVQRLQDLLARAGVKIFHSEMMDIHASGHAASDDLKLMVKLTQPKYFLPVHGYYYMMVRHKEHAISEGVPEENTIIPDNGSIVHITPDDWWFDKRTANVDNVMVDGLGVGDVGNVVIRDRQVLAEEGMFMLVVLINGKTGMVQGSPDIISRGFVYLKDNRELLSDVRKQVKNTVRKVVTKPINTTDIKNALREEIGLYLFKKTERRPMILPVVIEV